MPRTYELYLRKDQEVTFRALTSSPEEIFSRARAALEEDKADEVEVREAGRALFTLSA